ncbi:hypothetical protein DBV23_05700 [Edwardsiella ictaluri]|uniref:YqjK-like protein n=2 Tax=Edwardsiella ictaluri TaxID=67780 RepID=C5BH41_EDWI9|nr:YqjK family protein [Edwardsiella ictaluri]ACR67724.1 hypothetical protein NT01EI_0489 [Edwardsiella ictaluri 93-146]ARD40201.1 hypothetical protein B6E78_13190 [Edwardsiella ictaluri]AVZ81813.1 hypothetical protein DBV23_05700 [Edwardsiella ictaluri]EKS7762149.1 YqjK-like family protein [Edwardsiella ictaluri]EKS7768976.1 YqjK-like family protein [Edwardsiella ictaluri]
MNHQRQTLAAEKARLLQKIAQQRLDLHTESLCAERLCINVDRTLTTLWRLRRSLSLAAGLAVVYAARHPSRLPGGIKQAVGLWSTLRLARRMFYP